MSVRVESLIGLATLQGAPLPGYRCFGVPKGGAFDQESLQLGNALLGNRPGALAVELSNAALELLFDVPTRVAIVGTDCSNAAFHVDSGERLRVPAPRDGVRTYVCVVGGWIPDGIDSALARSGRPVRVGDVFACEDVIEVQGLSRLAAKPETLSPGPLRILRSLLSLSSELLQRTFSVSIQSDRTGIRLDGIGPVPQAEMPSEPACFGAIQLTPSGQLIVIGPDGPTIGGYPKLGFVASVDLDRLAHLRPGQRVTFEEVDLPKAKRLARDRQARLEAIVRQISLRR